MSHTAKWIWKMNYCKQNKIPAAESWAWNKAESAYNHFKDKR